MRWAHSWARRRDSTSVAASAHTWVSASSGSGSTSAHRPSLTNFTPSMSTTSALVVRCMISRITVPLRSHGVTTVSCTTWVTGSASTTDDSGRSTTASRSRSLASVIAAS